MLAMSALNAASSVKELAQSGKASTLSFPVSERIPHAPNLARSLNLRSFGESVCLAVDDKQKTAETRARRIGYMPTQTHAAGLVKAPGDLELARFISLPCTVERVLEEALDEGESEHDLVDAQEKPVSDALTAMCLSKIPPIGDGAPEATKLRIELDEQLSKLKAVRDGIRKAFSQNGFDVSDVEMKEMWMQAIDVVQG